MKKRTFDVCDVKRFKDYLVLNERSCATVEKYLRDVEKFMKHCGGKSLCKELVLDYKTALKCEYALTSANSMLGAVNSFLSFLGRRDCCVRQFKIQKKAYCSEERELSKGEYISLVKAAEAKSQRLSLLIQTICATGIRVSEVEYITVEAVRAGETSVSCKGKTRTVFISSKLCKKLLKYAKKQGIRSGKIFITKSGKPVNRSNIWSEMKKLCKTAGIEKTKVFPHNLRHLFARTFYQMEKDIAKLADILGHSNINTTRIYIISTGSEHKSKIEKMRLIT